MTAIAAELGRGDEVAARARMAPSGQPPPDGPGSAWRTDRRQRHAVFGSWRLIIIQTVVVVARTASRLLAFTERRDPPFILFNLVFSTQAAYATPLSLLSRNRQATWTGSPPNTTTARTLQHLIACHRDARGPACACVGQFRPSRRRPAERVIPLLVTGQLQQRQAGRHPFPTPEKRSVGVPETSARRGRAQLAPTQARRRPICWERQHPTT
jgi:hypothetical protein